MAPIGEAGSELSRRARARFARLHIEERSRSRYSQAIASSPGASPRAEHARRDAGRRNRGGRGAAAHRRRSDPAARSEGARRPRGAGEPESGVRRTSHIARAVHCRASPREALRLRDGASTRAKTPRSDHAARTTAHERLDRSARAGHYVSVAVIEAHARAHPRGPARHRTRPLPRRQPPAARACQRAAALLGVAPRERVHAQVAEAGPHRVSKRRAQLESRRTSWCARPTTFVRSSTTNARSRGIARRSNARRRRDGVSSRPPRATGAQQPRDRGRTTSATSLRTSSGTGALVRAPGDLWFHRASAVDDASRGASSPIFEEPPRASRPPAYKDLIGTSPPHRRSR